MTLFSFIEGKLHVRPIGAKLHQQPRCELGARKAKETLIKAAVWSKIGQGHVF
jgi:hypothetical protein